MDKQFHIGFFVFLSVIAIVALVNIALIFPYIIAIILGFMLKIMVTHPFRYLCSKGIGQKVSAGIVVIIVFFLVVGPLSAFITVAVKQAISIVQSLSNKDISSINIYINKFSKVSPLVDLFGGAQNFEKQIKMGISDLGLYLTNGVVSYIGRLPELTIQLVITIMTCFFMLIEGNRFISWVVDKIPLDSDVLEMLKKSFKDNSISVVWSSMVAALFQSLIMFLAYMVLGIPGAFLAAGATFIFSWVPILGSVPISFVAVMYLYTQDTLISALVMVAIGFFIGATDNIVRAVVLKGRGNMHPLVSLIAILGGIKLFGILGVFIGPLMAGILQSLLQIWPEVGRRFGVMPQIDKGLNQC